MVFVVESAQTKICECGGKIKWGRTARKGRLIGQCQDCKGWVFPANNAFDIDQRNGAFSRLLCFFGIGKRKKLLFSAETQALIDENKRLSERLGRTLKNA